MKKRFFIVSFLTVALFACSGEDGLDGAIGPQGEQGPQGQNGQDGTDGQEGQQGEPGTANVTYSDWLPNAFPDEPILDDTAFFNISIPELTDELKNSGVIQVYARRASSPGNFTITALPIISLEPVNLYYSYDYNSFNNNLTIRLASTDENNIGFFTYEEYRYVIIPGGIPTAGKATLDYAKMSYEEIVAHFSIPE